jgi:hypothetical protein
MNNLLLMDVEVGGRDDLVIVEHLWSLNFIDWTLVLLELVIASTIFNRKIGIKFCETKNFRALNPISNEFLNSFDF